MALAAWTRDLARQAGLAIRLLTRAPGFAAVALATLALGIGAPAAIFSIVDAVLLRPLPYPEPDRLVSFRIESATPRGPFGFNALPASQALTWGDEAATLSAMALYNDAALTLTSAEGPFRLLGVSATPNLFAVVGVDPFVGRTFEPATRNPRQVVLAYATWQRYFRGDRGVVGSTVTLDGAPYTVTGVMPQDFNFPDPETAFWVPVLIDVNSTRGMILPAVARLKPGATTSAVQQEGTRVLGSDDPRIRQTLIVRTMQEQMVGDVRRMLWIFMAAVGLVFVIATANIALLLLTRGTAREREFSVRLALGAGRGQLTRQLLVESTVLSALGGLLGVGLAALSLTALVHTAPRDIPRLRDAALDGTVLAFAAGLAVVASVIFGVLSAGRAVVADPVRALGRLGGDAHSAGSRGSRRRLGLLAAGEMALTMVLLVGAGLLLRSFVRLLLVDQGFIARGAVALQITLPASRYPTPAARLAFHERLLERLRATPGIETAGVTASMPNRAPSARMNYTATGIDPFFDPMTSPVAETRTISEGFFAAMGVPVRSGREFRDEDTAGAEPVIVISDRLARQQFPGREAVGQLLYSGLGGSRRVIGVVGDVRPAAGGSDTATAAYLPMRQDEGVFRWFATATVVARGRDTDAAARAMRALILSLDSEMPPFNVRTLSDEVSGLVAGPRFSASVLGLFAFVALVMATVGVYGVMAYAAGRRTQEIGIRVALGATRPQVLRMVIRDGVAIVSIGLVVGLTAAIWLARAMTGLLHEVTPADPAALGSVAALLLTAGLLAAYVPARRATRISALEALRDQ